MTKKKKTSHKHKKAHSASEKKEDEIIEEGLNAIYGDTKVDFSKVERSKARLTSILLTIVITLSVIAVTAWSAFLIYNKYFVVEEEETFTLEIRTDEQLVSGTKAKLKIYYANPTDLPMAAVEIDAKLPPAFQANAVSPAPTNEEELTWEIGHLNPGSDGTIIIEGVWIAEIPSNTPIQAFASYRPANFNSDFSDIKTTYITTLESVLEATITGAEEGKPGEDFDYTIEIKNTGTETLNNVVAQLSLPEGFFLNSSQPKVNPGAGSIWRFDSIAADSSETITLTGSFSADTEGFQYFDLITSITEAGRQLKQVEAQAFTDVLGDNLSLQLVANGVDDSAAIDAGSELRVAISLENVGSEDIEDLSLLLDFSASKTMPVIWSEAQLDEGATTSDGIYWNEESMGILTAGEKRVYNLSFPIKSTVTGDDADQMILTAEATIDGFTVQSTPIDILINTEAEFNTEARYFTEDGIPLGAGPLPPQVEEETTYRVFWQIDNALHELTEIKIEAMLPPHVNWLNKYDSDLGTIEYNETTRTITWQINRLPVDINTINSTFSISITPDEADIGTFVKLISGSTMKATDTVTEEEIVVATESLNTELPDDDFASGKGVVIQ